MADDGTPAHDDGRGRTATTPTDIPARGWREVAQRVRREAKQDQVPLLAAGVAFFALLALFPALVALISLYGLLADPADITRQVDSALAAAPAEVRDLISQQLTAIDDAGNGALIGVIVGAVLALWSASSGVGHLIDAVNAAYDEDDDRGFVRRKALALVLTLGAIAFVLFALAGIAAVPALVRAIELGVVGTVLAEVVRWIVLLGGLLAGLAVLYRWAPDRDDAKLRWVTPGAVFASVTWLLASVLFSVYVSSFGSYNETYGSLGAIVVVMLWLYLTALAIVLGAELNTELERQTAQDSTTGPSRRRGQRGAYAADTVAP